MINVILAMTVPNAIKLRQNFLYDEDGNRLRTDLTANQARKMRMALREFWKRPSIAGTDYVVLSLYVPEILNNAGTGLKWIEYLTDNWPNVFHIIGAWGADGLHYGTTATYDGDGNETISGTPMYPLHPQYMRIFPDDVVYDENGNETSRTPAAAPKEVNNIFGWKPRRW